MLAFLLFVATAARCPAGDPCPTADDLAGAVTAYDAKNAAAAADEAAAAGEIVMIHPRRVRRVTGVRCGDRLPPSTPTVICRYAIRYWNSTVHQTARLARRDGGWRIETALSVVRDRR